MSVAQRMRRSIKQRRGNVVLRSELTAMGSRSQVTTALNKLLEAGVLVRIGTGVYAKTRVSSATGSVIPAGSLETLSAEALRKLNVAVTPGRAAGDYNEGRTTQIPGTLVVNTGTRRIQRRIAVGGRSLAYESMRTTAANRPSSTNRHEQLLNREAFMAAMGLSQRALSRLLATRSVFSVDIDGTTLYPALYADPRVPRRHLYAVSRRLGDLSPGAKLQFLVTPKGSLSRVSPLTALARGRLADVLRAADGYSEGTSAGSDRAEALPSTAAGRRGDETIVTAPAIPGAGDTESEPARAGVAYEPQS